jgi:hypothetical protein
VREAAVKFMARNGAEVLALPKSLAFSRHDPENRLQRLTNVSFPCRRMLPFLVKLCQLAQRYGHSSLIVHCSARIVPKIVSENVLDFYTWAVDSELTNLREAAVKFMARNGAKVLALHQSLDFAHYDSETRFQRLTNVSFPRRRTLPSLVKLCQLAQRYGHRRLIVHCSAQIVPQIVQRLTNVVSPVEECHSVWNGEKWGELLTLQSLAARVSKARRLLLAFLLFSIPLLSARLPG